MTRGCLTLSILLVTTGGFLSTTGTAHCQVSADYYRFAPIYRNVYPYVDGCTTNEENQEPAQVDDETDLRGRSVVAIIECSGEETGHDQEGPADCQGSC